MKTAILLGILAIAFCACTPEAVNTINQQIEERYSSFSSLQYTIHESSTGGSNPQSAVYTEKYRRPDMIKQIFESSTTRSGGQYICRGNTAYSISGDTLSIYEYTNLPAGMDSYCGYFVNKNKDKWVIPESITDTEKYRVSIVEADLDGAPAYMATVTVLNDPETLEKMRADGLEPPKEAVGIYWFAKDTFAILREEWTSSGMECGGTGNLVATGGTEQDASASGPSDCREVTGHSTRTYDGFIFDGDIPDSEFQVDETGFVNVNRETVDATKKFS